SLGGIMSNAYHVTVRAAVIEKLPHAGRQIAGGMWTAKLTKEVRKAQTAYRPVNRTFGRPAEERSDGRGDAGDGMDTTGDFLNVDARITYLYWHYLFLRQSAQLSGELSEQTLQGLCIGEVHAGVAWLIVAVE